MLKPILLGIGIFFVSAASQGQQNYGWCDATGVMSYSDIPPASEVRDVKKLKLTPGHTIIPGYKAASGGELGGQVTGQTGAATASGTSTPSTTTTASGSGISVSSSGSSVAGGSGASFPRLLGMNIGAKNYHDPRYQKEMARLDVVILGFIKGWNPANYATSTLGIQKAVQAIKTFNPNILVGQYTILNETYDDPNDTGSLDVRQKLYDNGWWLLNAKGNKVQWTTKYSAWEINFTEWTTPDSRGQHFPQWIAERDYNLFFRDIPEFDIWYLDNVSDQPLLALNGIKADWNLDKVDDSPTDPTILAAHYAGHVAEWNRIRQLRPNALLMGNTNGDLSQAEWSGQLNGGFLEALMGKSWSIETRGGWSQMMARYRAVMSNLKEPKILGFNVHGNSTDYRFFRYAYTSCLLDNGYFSFTNDWGSYSSVSWFDEYDFKLGKALSAPPTTSWQQGVWRRDFENGTALVNPTGGSVTVTLEPGFRRLSGTQDPAINNGSAVSQVTLGPKDGIVLSR